MATNKSIALKYLKNIEIFEKEFNCKVSIVLVENFQDYVEYIIDFHSKNFTSIIYMHNKDIYIQQFWNSLIGYGVIPNINKKDANIVFNVKNNTVRISFSIYNKNISFIH